MAQPGTLYLIPAPLGEEGDISSVIPEQVRRIAAALDTFVVEHPKTARQVLKRLGTQIPLQQIQLVVLDKDTPPEQLARLLQPLLAGKNVGLMSEAGCPAVADPGALLVRLAHDKGIPVAPLVGPSSILLALMASGLNGQRFAFHGYLPAREPERSKRITELEKESRQRQQTQLFIETPYRNAALFDALLAACQPQTLLCLASELTTTGESIITHRIADWRRVPKPALERRPTVFLLLSAR